jgi:hypothetical protein
MVGTNSAAAEDAFGSRPRSIGNDPLTRKERRELKEVTRRLSRSQVYSRRPKTRGDREARVTGPCPWVSCRHHLYLEVDNLTGAIKLNFPGKEIDEIGETCSLRAADRGAHTYDATGARLNITLERARRLEREGRSISGAESRHRTPTRRRSARWSPGWSRPSKGALSLEWDRFRG